MLGGEIVERQELVLMIGQRSDGLRGDELFYTRGSAMMRVSVQPAPSFRAGPPEVLFEGRYRPSYDVTDDGRHFIMVTRAHPALTHLNVILNWAEELERLASAVNESN